MKYGITRRVLGCNEFIDITKDEFEGTLRARDCFFDALGIEEKFDLVAENYAEFENELLQLTVRRMLFDDIDWASFRKDLRSIHRRLANLLSACRLYVDQSKHDLSSIYGRTSDVYEKFDKALSHEYDSRLGYCLLEAIRNHMQHRGLPLFQLGYPETRDFPGNTKHHRKATCVPSISVPQLKQEKAFQRNVLARIPEDAELLDIRPLVRDYVAGIGSVHKQLRGLMSAEIKTWEAVLVGMRDRYRAIYGSNDVGLAVVERDDRNCGDRFVPIFDDFLGHYPDLVRKNRNPEHYATQFASSEVVA